MIRGRAARSATLCLRSTQQCRTVSFRSPHTTTGSVWAAKVVVAHVRRLAASAEDLELVVEHDGLKIQLIEAAADEQAEQPAQQPVPDEPEHLGSLMAESASLRTAKSEWPIEFLLPNTMWNQSDRLPKVPVHHGQRERIPGQRHNLN